jgi:hypothetical protein
MKHHISILTFKNPHPTNYLVWVLNLILTWIYLLDRFIEKKSTQYKMLKFNKKIYIKRWNWKKNKKS